jgi:guanylate kinase
MKGLLLVITAPSGAGKTTLIAAAMKADPRLRLSVSYTTRPARPGESNGLDYHFVGEAEFVRMLEAGEFVESALVHGYRYGTTQKVIDASLGRDEDLILEIDWQGAQQVRRLYPDCVGIFILPPSLADLEQRMRSRAQDSDAVIQRRLANAREELEHVAEFDYAIMNRRFDEASADLAGIIRAERARTRRQLERHPSILT